MAEFPDLLINPNPNAPTLDASGNQVRGINFFDTTAERDALNITVRTLGALAVIKGSDELYQYTADTVDDTAWQDEDNWLGIGSAGGSGVQNLNNLDGNVTLTAGDGIDIDVVTGSNEIEISATGGGGGVTTFVALNDTPSSYSGEVNKPVVVNGSETGLVFGSTLKASIIGQTLQYVLSQTTLSSAGDHEGEVFAGLGSGSQTVGDVLYWDGTNWAQANASAEATAKGLLSIATVTGNPGLGVLHQGFIQLAAAPGSAGDVLYLDTTDGLLTNDVSAFGATQIVRVCGYNVGNNLVYFNPSADWIELQ